MTLVFPVEIVFLAVIALAVSSVGWFKFVYFISIGYAFSVCAFGVVLLIMCGIGVPPAGWFLCILFILYGLRLGGYLILREMKSVSYQKALPELTKTSKPLNAGAKFAIWFSVCALYIMQTSAVFYRLYNCTVKDAELSRIMENPRTWTWAFIGAAIMTVALILETIADWQKSNAKKADPHRFCDTGLYRIVRCPNYFAEILFWTGCFLSGIGALQGTQWIIAAFGYAGIVYIMFGGARRLELRQNKNYGTDAAYQAYTAKTPILLPFIPLYHLADMWFLKG